MNTVLCRFGSHSSAAERLGMMNMPSSSKLNLCYSTMISRIIFLAVVHVEGTRVSTGVLVYLELSLLSFHGF